MSEPPAPETIRSGGLTTSNLFVLHLLYAAAMVISSFAVFDAVGVLIGVIIVVVWASLFGSRSLAMAMGTLCMLGFLLFCPYWLLTPYGSPREAAPSSVCKNNLKQILLAMHNYHDMHGSFPPAYVADEQGRPMHSWRVLLLPYIDGNAIYGAYRFDEPWDSPENRKLLKTVPPVYACPTHISSDDATTTYVAVVGPTTGWPGSRGRSLDEFTDGAPNTVLIVEHDSNDILWTEPRDVDLDTAIRLLGSTQAEAIGAHRRSVSYFEFEMMRHLAWADGSVRTAPPGLRPDFAESLFVINDGGPAGNWDLSRETTAPYRRLRNFNVFSLAVFVILALLPLPWVWRSASKRGRERD